MKDKLPPWSANWQEDCEPSLAAIAEATGLSNRLALYSTHEFKKVRVRYFTAEEKLWKHAQALQ